MRASKRTSHILMIVLIIIWTVDAVTVSKAVESMNQLFLLGFKTLFSVPVIGIYAAIKKQICIPAKQDIPLLIVATMLGDVLYFYFEYTAYIYIPIGTVTVTLGMMPVFSYIYDCMTSKRKPKLSVLALIIFSITGLFLVVSNETGEGAFMGYLSCALGIVTWIRYGYVLRILNRTYSSVSISFIEAIMATLIMLPRAMLLRPRSISVTEIIIYIVIMGMLTSGFGYMIEVNGLIELGTTVSGIYFNFLPVFTALAGFIFLRQRMRPLQILGAVIVILCGLIILLKKADEV